MTETHHKTDMMQLTDVTHKMKLNGDLDDSEGKMNKFLDKQCYENVFVWDMKKLSKKTDEIILEFTTVDKFQRILQRQSKMLTFIDGSEVFRLHKFYLRLIICYELFTNERFEESLIEMKDFVKYMENILFDKSNEPYIAAYNHMLYSTYAYVMSSMNLDNIEEVMKNVKLLSELNNDEKSAVHAVKALTFMRYPSNSKHIAFQEADEACRLKFGDAEWIHIWLTAKGRLNREYNNYKEPDDDEIKFAEHLNNISQTYFHLMTVNSVFTKVFRNTMDKNKKETYYKLAFKTLMMAIELAGNDEHLIFKCIKIAIDRPFLLIPQSIIEEKIQILQHFKHPKINSILGNYYFKQIKNLKKAKEYYTFGKDTDIFCVLRLLQLECISKPFNQVSFVETLMDSYEDFPNDIARVRILSQILLYFTYYKEDHKQFMQYLKLFMDQPFDDAFKYRHLNSVQPIFHIKNFNRHTFVNDLINNIKYSIKNCKWDIEEKKIIEDTFQRFSKLTIEIDPKKIYDSWC